MTPVFWFVGAIPSVAHQILYTVIEWLWLGISPIPNVWFTSHHCHPIELKSEENNVCVPLCEPVVLIEAPHNTDDTWKVFESITVT